MPHEIRVTTAVATVLAVFLEDPAADRYGLDLMRATDQPSGTLYPILSRLLDAGWVVANWESEHDPVVEGRPARRYYRLTPHGVTAARAAVADLSQRLARASMRQPKPRTA